MRTQPLYQDSHSALGDVFPRRNTQEPLLGNIDARAIAIQDTADLDLALELIEIRYQEHLAHQDLRALFGAGELYGPCRMSSRDSWSDP